MISAMDAMAITYRGIQLMKTNLVLIIIKTIILQGFFLEGI